MRFDNLNEQHWQLWDWTNEQHRLIEEIEAMEAEGLYPHSSLSYGLWDMFTEYGVLPYAGGYLDQPAWFDKDVRYFNKKQYLISLGVMIEQHQERLQAAKEPVYKDNIED